MRRRLVRKSADPQSQRQTRSDAPEPRKRVHAPPRLDNLSTASRASRSNRELERDAEDAAARITRGDGARVRSGEQETASAPSTGGHPLRPELRHMAEAGLGLDTSGIRVHDDRDAELEATARGARAFADGAGIWLGPGESELDRDLMAHELAHVAQGEVGVHLRSATWLERRAWLSFFDHYLPRKFLNNYMDDTGAPITLSQQEMTDVNPIVNIRRSPDFNSELTTLQAQVKASNVAGTPAPAAKYIEVSGPGQALTNGTLGNFTIHYKGVLVVTPNGNWIFTGVMDFYDVWDFDPKPFGTSGRSTAGEVKTRVAAYGLPGSSFEIFSVQTACLQSGTDRRAVWAGGTPQHVPDQAGRAGADIDVGAAGGVAGGPETEVGGAEVGAQSAEDLNP